MKKAVSFAIVLMVILSLFNLPMVASAEGNVQVYDFWKVPPSTVGGALDVTTGNWRFKDIVLSDNTYWPYDYFEPAWGNYYLGHWRSGCIFSSKQIELFENGGASYQFIPDAAGYARIMPTKLFANTAGTETYSARIAVNGVTIWPAEGGWKTFTYATNPSSNSIETPELSALLTTQDVVAFELKSNKAGGGSVTAGWSEIQIIERKGIDIQKTNYDYWNDTETLAVNAGYNTAGSSGELLPNGNWGSYFVQDGTDIAANWFVYDWNRYLYSNGIGGYANYWDVIEYAPNVTSSMRWQADVDCEIVLDSTNLSMDPGSVGDSVQLQIYKNDTPILSQNPITINKTLYLHPNKYVTPKMTVKMKKGDIIKYDVTAGENSTKTVWTNMKISKTWANIDANTVTYSAADDILSYMWGYKYSLNSGATYKALQYYHDWGYVRTNEVASLVGIGVVGGSQGLLCSSIIDTNKSSIEALVFNPQSAGLFKINESVAQAFWGNSTTQTNVRIMKNGTQIWPASGWSTLQAYNEATSDDAVLVPEKTVALNIGDELRFESSLPENASLAVGSGAQVYWMPTVSKVSKLEILSAQGIQLDTTGELVYGISTAATAESVKAKFANSEYVTVTKGLSTLSNTDVVGTGCVIKLSADAFTVDTLSIVIKGDADGNGSISIGDLLLIKKQILQAITLENSYSDAADISKDGLVTLTDLIAIKKHLLKIQLVVQ